MPEKEVALRDAQIERLRVFESNQPLPDGSASLRDRWVRIKKAVAAPYSRSSAATYGITPASLAVLKKETDDYAAFIVAPQDAIAVRSALTESLPQLLRSTTALFDQLEDFLPQFATTPAGQNFQAAYLASTAINQRGRGPSPTR